MDINESRVFTDFLLRNSDFDVERKRLVLNRKLDLFGLNIYIFLQTLLMYLIIGFSTQTVSRPCSASSSCGPSTDWIPSLTNVPRLDMALGRCQPQVSLLCAQLVHALGEGKKKLCNTVLMVMILSVSDIKPPGTTARNSEDPSTRCAH